MTPQDKKYCIYFDEIAEKILKNVPEQIRNMFKSNQTSLIKILWITYIIGMKSIIEKDLQM